MESTYSEVADLLEAANQRGPSFRFADELCRIGKFVRERGTLTTSDLHTMNRRLSYWWPRLKVAVQLQSTGADGMELVLRDDSLGAATILV